MMTTRRLALSLLCTTSLTAALVTASPAVADAQVEHRAAACGAAADVTGTFTGTFESDPTTTLSVTFTAPRSVTTQWTVEGWQGSGSGEYESGATGPQWTNSDTTTGPITGVDSEVFRSVQVECADNTGEVTTIIGVVDAGRAQIPFSITRQ